MVSAFLVDHNLLFVRAAWARRRQLSRRAGHRNTSGDYCRKGSRHVMTGFWDKKPRRKSDITMSYRSSADVASALLSPSFDYAYNIQVKHTMPKNNASPRLRHHPRLVALTRWVINGVERAPLIHDRRTSNIGVFFVYSQSTECIIGIKFNSALPWAVFQMIETISQTSLCLYRSWNMSHALYVYGIKRRTTRRHEGHLDYFRPEFPLPQFPFLAMLRKSPMEHHQLRTINGWNAIES